ncbi:hypothetical protein GRI75_12880 [Altererythrobacter soli]|uniref:Uncharacterized protein n=1 Tax=Croceibacterium soli TaxID=1739690 RepID=A0A6I4V0L6_9SPHN|nr:hypothetical protein [Croceibacterium soli]MXP42535.1 hypothetical protein [Croceibacterium soli]
MRAFTGADNEDLGLLTLVHAATLDVEEIGDLQRKSHDVMRKRIGTLRSPCSPFNGFAANGWFEVDAVSAEHMAYLFPQRRQLLEELAIPLRYSDPTWIVTSHSIVYLNGMPLAEVKKSLSTMWELPSQMDLRGLRDWNRVEDNLEGIAGYATKFCCTVELKADVEGGKVFMPWPMNWEADLCAWMNSYQRDTRELLRFSIGQARVPVEPASVPLIEPMPFTWSIS